MQYTDITRFLSSLISVYLILLFIRILLSWFHGPSMGKPFEILSRITDPYLNYFRGVIRLRTGNMDFSPLAAILVLVVIQNILTTITTYGKITLGIVISLVLGAVWSAISFFITFFFILILVRFFSILLSDTGASFFWKNLDIIIEPILRLVRRVVPNRKIVSYQTELVIGAVVLLLFSITGRILINLLLVFLRRLPI